MTSQREAKAIGYDTGYGIAQMSWPPRRMTKEGVEKFIDDCAEGETNGRQYSPFEFTASDFNSSRYPDEVWDAYDAGVMNGIRACVRDSMKKTKILRTKKGVKTFVRRAAARTPGAAKAPRRKGR